MEVVGVCLAIVKEGEVIRVASLNEDKMKDLEKFARRGSDEDCSGFPNNSFISCGLEDGGQGSIHELSNCVGPDIQKGLSGSTL